LVNAIRVVGHVDDDVRRVGDAAEIQRAITTVAAAVDLRACMHTHEREHYDHWKNFHFHWASFHRYQFNFLSQPSRK
jgi:hypothetical protein